MDLEDELAVVGMDTHNMKKKFHDLEADKASLKKQIEAYQRDAARDQARIAALSAEKEPFHNQGETWERLEDDDLKKEYATFLDNTSVKHGRTVNAIIARLKRVIYDFKR